MKSIITAIVASLFLIACQSTSPKVIVNTLDKEQQLNKNVAFLKSEISLGKQEKRYDLALIYSSSFEQNKRKLAKPLLKQLVEEEDVNAIVLLAQLEFLGRLGYVSDSLFKEHYKKIIDKDPEAIKNYKDEKAEMETALELNFSSMKQLYDENKHLCEQPLEQPEIDFDKNSDAYLVAKYFYSCLEKYSIKNSKQRLQVMSEFQAIMCNTKESNKTCISEGYNALSLGLNSIEESFVVAAAIRNIYKSHKDQLRKKNGLQKRNPSSETGKVLVKAFDAYNESDLDKSSEILISYITNTKQLTPFDKAYVEKFISQILFQRDKEGDTELVISYANRALSSNELSYKDHWDLFDLLSDIYLHNEEYSKYINLIGNYILENQGNMDLIPVNSISESNIRMTSNSNS